jgi:DNA-directed RNA polymerase specialized sigma24 family protein
MRRRILELSFIEGLSAMETAHLLGRSVNYIYDQKHAAIKKLRDALLRGGERDE